MFEDAKPRRIEVAINTKTHLVAEHAALNEELAAALTNQTDRPARMTSRGDPAGVNDLAGRIEALEAEMADSWVTFVLRPRPKKEWRKFRTDHQPAEADDAYAGVDLDAFLRLFVPKCVVEPELTEEDWARAFDQDAPGIWPGDQDRLVATVFSFYIATFDVPKSRLLSGMTRIAEEQQQQLETSVSPADGSKGGNHPSGTTTSTRKVSSPGGR